MGVPAAAPVAMAQDMAGMDASAMPQRVPVDVTPAMLQALGVRIEEVGRESLTQSIQAVATVAPDESRISHAHTRVAGWVEQLDVNTTGESTDPDPRNTPPDTTFNAATPPQHPDDFNTAPADNDNTPATVNWPTRSSTAPLAEPNSHDDPAGTVPK